MRRLFFTVVAALVLCNCLLFIACDGTDYNWTGISVADIEVENNSSKDVTVTVQTYRAGKADANGYTAKETVASRESRLVNATVLMGHDKSAQEGYASLVFTVSIDGNTVYSAAGWPSSLYYLEENVSYKYNKYGIAYKQNPLTFASRVYTEISGSAKVVEDDTVRAVIVDSGDGITVEWHTDYLYKEST